MDFEKILALLGLALTFLGIYLTIKSKLRAELTLYTIQKINLFNSFVKNLPNLSITYKENNINENLYFIKAAIVNSGNLDITENMISKFLSLELDKNNRWLDTKIVSVSAGLDAKIIIESSNKVNLDFGMFRAGEFLMFETLIEVNSNSSRESNKKNSMIRTNHRIANTKQVKEKKLDRRVVPMSSAIIFYFVLLLMFILPFLGNGFDQKKIIYEIKNSAFYKGSSEDKLIEVEIKEMLTNQIKISDTQSGKEKVVDVAKFFDEIVINPKIVNSKKAGIETYIVFGILLIALILLPIRFIIKRKNQVKLLKLLNLND